ncbi:tetratricopeptide repeat protein, partial [Ameyamaea chiangmaiensis]
HLGGEAGMAAHAATLAGEGAQSWLAAHQPKRACASAATARHLAADDPALRLLEARVALTCDRVALALSDLAAPFDEPSLEGQALIVRAQALRMAGHPDQAAALADESLRRHADDPAALLERGIDRAQAGSLRAARADWERVLEIAPDAPEANLARQDLSVMDADPDRSDAAQ